MIHYRLMILFFAMAVVSCGNRSQPIENSGQNNNPDSLKEQTTAELSASDLYTKNCKFCHGGYGDGDGVKARLSDGAICPFDLSKENNPDEIVYQVIQNGRGKMPSHKELAEEEIKQLVVFIKSFAS